jgi:GAF domain-containing protein
MDGFAQQFAEFAAALSESSDFEDTADQVVQYAVKVTGATCGGITVIRPGRRWETVGATDDKVTEADARQYELEEGPCLDASNEMRSVMSGHLAEESRWPRWGPQAAEVGLSSVLSAEIRGRGARVGALNLYSVSRDAFDSEDVELARVLASQGAVVLAVLRDEDGLREALETRTLIGQAQGLLMERFEIDAHQAFAVLRRYSQDANIKLRDVADQLIETRAVPEQW